MKNKIIPVFFASVLLLGGALSLTHKNNINKVHAYDDMSLSASGDAFKLMDKEYDDD